MAEKSTVISTILHPGIIPILRLKDINSLIPLGEALYEGGVTTLELTLTTPDAIQGIRSAAGHFSNRLTIGVGTVLNADDAARSVDAGASFVVTPVLAEDVVEFCRVREIVILCGALTPTEVFRAWKCGADFVKIFPAETGNASYIKALRGPFPQIRFIPTGGVNLQTITGFLDAGCSAVGVGGALLDPTALETGDWAKITHLTKSFVQVVNQRAKNP